MSEIQYIRAGNLYLEDKMIQNAIIEIENGMVKEILEKLPAGKRYMDYGEFSIMPGFVDVHIHGYGGYEVMEGTRESLAGIGKAILRTGVTSYFPTLLTASTAKLTEIIQLIGENHETLPGAKIAGIFLEGPFLAEKQKGAQNAKYFQLPDLDLLQHWMALAAGLPVKIAVAPELEGAISFIQSASELGAVVCLGHSDASYEQVMAAVEVGGRTFVHGYNCMSPLHHRHPGMVGAMLTAEETYVELIADGQHVHAAAAELMLKARGKERILLISDSMMAGGMPKGGYQLGELPVTVHEGAVRLESGKLAGSVLSLDQAIRNVIDWGLATSAEAVRMASLNPAKSVGLDDKIGRIDCGRTADFVVMDEHFQTVAVYLEGKLVCVS